MPITSTYEFTDDGMTVSLRVPLKGSTYDVELADLFLKINQPPYLLALDLYAEVDVGSAEVTVDHTTRLISCVLRKATPFAWPQATCTEAASPQALRERREASLARKAVLDEQVRQRGLGGQGRPGLWQRRRGTQLTHSSSTARLTRSSGTPLSP